MTIISDIHLNTLRSTQSFEDFYEKYGIHRRPVNMFACTVIFVVSIIDISIENPVLWEILKVQFSEFFRFFLLSL